MRHLREGQKRSLGAHIAYARTMQGRTAPTTQTRQFWAGFHPSSPNPSSHWWLSPTAPANDPKSAAISMKIDADSHAAASSISAWTAQAPTRHCGAPADLVHQPTPEDHLLEVGLPLGAVRAWLIPTSRAATEQPTQKPQKSDHSWLADPHISPHVSAL